jgi:hypothetical protein
VQNLRGEQPCHLPQLLAELDYQHRALGTVLLLALLFCCYPFG